MAIWGRTHISEEELSLLLDNRLEERARRHVESHLDTCSRCRADYEALRQTVHLLQTMPRVAVPRAFTLSEADIGSKTAPSRSPGWTRWASVFVALALVVVIGLDLFTSAVVGPVGFQAPPPEHLGAAPAPEVAVTLETAKAAAKAPAPEGDESTQPTVAARVAPLTVATVEPAPQAPPASAQAVEEAPPPSSELPAPTRGWRWYRWAEITLGTLLVLLLILGRRGRTT